MTPSSPYRDVDFLRRELLAMVGHVLDGGDGPRATVEVSAEWVRDIAEPGTNVVRPFNTSAATVYLEPTPNDAVFITAGEYLEVEYLWGDANWEKALPDIREIFSAVVEGSIYVLQEVHNGAVGTSRPYLKLADRQWHRFRPRRGERLPLFRKRRYDRIDYQPYAPPGRSAEW